MDLDGLKGIAAYQTYLRTIFYIRLIRETLDVQGKSFPECVQIFKDLDEKSKKRVLIELIAIAPLNDREIMRLCAPHSDKNGNQYNSTNIHNLSFTEVLELCVDTLVECSNAGEDLFFYLTSN